MDTDNIVNQVMLIALGLMVVAGVLVGATSFQNTQWKCPTDASYTLNSTYANCYNSTDAVDPVYNSAINITKNTNGLVNNFGSQLPTVGTMFGVALILGAIGLIGVGIAVGAKALK